jgi:hypothetical protein
VVSLRLGGGMQESGTKSYAPRRDAKLKLRHAARELVNRQVLPKDDLRLLIFGICILGISYIANEVLDVHDLSGASSCARICPSP